MATKTVKFDLPIKLGDQIIHSFEYEGNIYRITIENMGNPEHNAEQIIVHIHKE